MIDPKTFVEVTEALLLKDIGERFKSFFDEHFDEYVTWDECQKAAGDLKTLYQKVGGIHQELAVQPLLYFKRSVKNPRSAITPVGQINMVANVTFHLMAQQIALLFTKQPGINKTKVYETAFENVKKLTIQYLKMIEAEQEGAQDGKALG